MNCPNFKHSKLMILAKPKLQHPEIWSNFGVKLGIGHHRTFFPIIWSNHVPKPKLQAFHCHSPQLQLLDPGPSQLRHGMKCRIWTLNYRPAVGSHKNTETQQNRAMVFCHVFLAGSEKQNRNNVGWCCTGHPKEDSSANIRTFNDLRNPGNKRHRTHGAALAHTHTQTLRNA